LAWVQNAAKEEKEERARQRRSSIHQGESFMLEKRKRDSIQRKRVLEISKVWCVVHGV
jgi:hypothetical protein